VVRRFGFRFGGWVHACPLTTEGKGYRIFVAWRGRVGRAAQRQALILLARRFLAKSYATLNEKQLAKLIEDKDLMEICHDEK